jgi:phosphate-selective porin OprO/OprP
VVGYDAKADKFLDTNVKYKLLGNANHFLQLGQFKQPNSLEELSSTKNNDFISKAASPTPMPSPAAWAARTATARTTGR